MIKRVFLVVLDSLGIGYAQDAEEFGDLGANTLKSVAASPYFHIPNLRKLGLLNIDGIHISSREKNPAGIFGRLSELSKGKDTTAGHWEICGHITKKPFPVYPNGFPEDVIAKFTSQTGRGVLCNRPYSGTQVIMDYGEEHLKTGSLIVYTSADSVFQIAAHEDCIPVEKLYEFCGIARKILVEPNHVGRVVARPFTGKKGNFTRTSNRHDFSLEPPGKTLLDVMKEKGFSTIGIGKIYDIFAGRGITEYSYASGNKEGMMKTMDCLSRNFTGLCFTNLVDFDMLYGHRNDVDGYAKALAEFDRWLQEFCVGMKNTDLLMITADHGCDPGFLQSTDHTREQIPLCMYSPALSPGNLGSRTGFGDIGATIADIFQLKHALDGNSFWPLIKRR